VVGVYASDVDNGAYARVCQYFFIDDMTVANEWYYWDSETSSAPAKWRKGESLFMSQDEGKLAFKVLSKTTTGMKLKWDIVGWGEGDEEIIHSEVLTLTK
jgi:hypothetical protein